MAKDYRRLWKDVTSTTDEAKAVRTLAMILADKEGRVFISRLERGDAELCIEILDHGIALHNLRTAEKQKFFVTLRRLAGDHGRLPDSMILTERIEVSDKIIASGGFADVRTGEFMGGLVAVKTIRVAEKDDISKIRKQFCKEAILWSTVTHPNVLKLVGVRGDMEKGQFVTVSEWMEHGNIMEYIKKNAANRLELLHGAVLGLEYLHGANLTHGDLKGANILMSNGTPPRACLADFGFMTMVLDPGQPMSCSASLEGGTLTFMSPELLVPSKFGMKDSIPTPEADIYAFGLVIFQVLTGKIPFHGIRQAELGYSVVNGLRPDRPEDAPYIGFSDLLWDVVQRCWDADMKLRPKVVEIVTHLEGAAANWDGLMPPCTVTENVPSDSTEEMSGSMKYCGIFRSSSGVAPGSPAESQAPSGLFSCSSTQSTQYSEPPQEEPEEVAAKPFDEPEPKSRVPTRSRSEELRPEPRVTMRSRSEEPRPELRASVQSLPAESQPELLTSIRSRTEDIHEDPQIYPHLDQHHDPPPSQLPQRKRKGFRYYFKAKFRGFFHLGR